jgi:Asp-tRNA(Asn)/Glu-tRNA(Gln) amidotransferase A subunit family amidase
LEALRAWQNEKRSATIAAVKTAIEELERQGAEVTFKAVSEKSGVSRKSLYAASEAKALIMARKKNDDKETLMLTRIAELERENKRLKDVLYLIRSRIGALGLQGV